MQKWRQQQYPTYLAATELKKSYLELLAKVQSAIPGLITVPSYAL